MADLTIGEVGIVLQLNLTFLDETVQPPVQKTLDLTNGTITLLFAIADSNSLPKVPISKIMSILGPPANGVAQYVFQSGDLVKPPDMSKFGVFRFSVKVVYPDGTILFAVEDGQLTIKDDSVI